MLTRAMCAALGMWLLAADQAPSADSPQPALVLDRTIALEGVNGRIDHLALDRDGKRLLVAALGNGSVEVIDLAANKVVGRVSDLPEPQGVAWLASAKQVVVSCGGDGTCRLYDATTLKEIARVHAGEDADNIRVDSRTGLIYVGAAPGLVILEAAASALARRGEIALVGHAESFQLEQDSPRIFVNVPEAKQVQMVDREKRTVIATWNLAEMRGNFPMALDEAGHRVLVACRNPATLLTLDAESGKTLSTTECAGDADEVFFDAARGRAYVIGGEGFIDSMTSQADHEWRRERINTVRGARTGLFDAMTGTIYLAVPRRGEQAAEIRVFRIHEGR